jgi:hypothetical protein
MICQQLSAQPIRTSISPASEKDSIAHYDKLLSVSQMQQDLRLFRDIRNKANSGLYRYRTRRQIDSIYNWALKNISKPLNTNRFYKIILTLTDFEGSCHNYTELDEQYLSYLRRKKSFFPYPLKYVEGKILFNNVTDKIPLGAAIQSINGVNDSLLMASFRKYMPADGYTTTEKLSGSVNNSFGIRYLLEYGLTDSFAITYLPHHSNRIQSVTLPAVSLEEREKNLALRHSAKTDSLIDYKVQPSYSFRMLDSSTALLNFRIFSMASGTKDPAFRVYVNFIDSVFNILHKNGVQNLVMDIRGNPGGSDPMFEQPMMYLTDQPFRENTLAYTIFDEVPYEQYFWGITTAAKMGSQDIVEGKKFLKGYFPALVNGRNLQDPKHNPLYHPKSPAFKGHLYMLIDEGVASAGSHLASLVKAYARNLTIVGVETCGGYYGHNGHMPLVYQLPNSGIKTKFSIVYVDQDAPYKPDQPIGRGIIPDYEVGPTFDDFMANRDTQIEFVQRLINKAKVTGHR